jgi:hypothetical protein
MKRKIRNEQALDNSQFVLVLPVVCSRLASGSFVRCGDRRLEASELLAMALCVHVLAQAEQT